MGELQANQLNIFRIKNQNRNQIIQILSSNQSPIEKI
jgi:hypothetical protein